MFIGVRQRLSRSFWRSKSSSGFQVDALDGLRGVAVLCVLLSHLSSEFIMISPKVSFLGLGHVGVFLFFVLSFFLLTTLLIRADHARLLTFGFWGRYFVRRVQRIYPLYTIAVVLSFVFTRFTSIDWFVPISYGVAMLDHLLMRQGKLVFWTVAVEFKYYFVLPLIVIGFSSMVNRKSYRDILTGVLSWLCIPFVIGGLEWYAPITKAKPYAVVFFAGSAAAFLNFFYLKRRSDKSSRREAVIFEAAAWIAVAVLFLTTPAVLGFFTASCVWDERFKRSYEMYAFLLTVILWGALHGTGFLRRILETKPLRFTGIISFSIYLWHMPVLNALNSVTMNNTVRWILCVALTYAVSTLSYLLIEERTRFVRAEQTKSSSLRAV